MRQLALSGWGQPHDALSELVPGAESPDYAAHKTLEAAIKALEPHKDAEAVIGWSMGGQLAVRAIMEGVLKPKKLVLIASPYQFLQTKELPLGFGPLTFEKYRDNMAKNPDRTLNKSYALIAHGDANAEAMQPLLTHHRARLPEHDWLYWLDEMAGYSAAGMDLSRLPPTLLIHGEKDVVIEPEQSKAWAVALPEATLKLLPDAGHAPHWHDAPRVRQWIQEFTA